MGEVEAVDKVASIIAAAGKGSRLGGSISKQYRNLRGRPLLAHTINIFENLTAVKEIIIVARKDELNLCNKLITSEGFNKVSAVVSGGSWRQDSVYRGFKALSSSTDFVVVHDGARPLLTYDIFNRVLDAAVEYGAAVPAVPVKDTIKISDDESFVKSTLDRTRLRAVQTPQIFRYGILYEAYRLARQKWAATDEAFLVEAAGYRVKMVTGDYENIKITTQEDLLLAEIILERRKNV